MPGFFSASILCPTPTLETRDIYSVQPAQCRGARSARGQLSTAVDRRRDLEPRRAKIRAPVFQPERRACTVRCALFRAKRQLFAARRPTVIRFWSGHASAFTSHAVNFSSLSASMSRSRRRRVGAARVRALKLKLQAEGCSMQPQKAPADLPAPPWRNHIAIRCRDPRRVEGAAPPFTASCR